MPLQHPTGTAPFGLEAMDEAHVDQRTGWLDRMESLIERYPWPTLLLALGVGYMLARRIR